MVLAIAFPEVLPAPENDGGAGMPTMPGGMLANPRIPTNGKAGPGAADREPSQA